MTKEQWLILFKGVQQMSFSQPCTTEEKEELAEMFAKACGY